MIVALKSANGLPIGINPDHVEQVTQAVNASGQPVINACIVFLKGGLTQAVQGNCGEVIDKLNDRALFQKPDLSSLVHPN